MKRRKILAGLLSALMLGFALNFSAFAEDAKIELKTEADFAKAVEESKADGKVVMLEFTGSDWCPPCKMLHKFVTGTDEFAKYANENIRLVIVDLNTSFEPKNKKQSQNYVDLMKKYKIRAVPTVILINAKTGKEDVMVGLETRTPEELINRIKALQ